jgi:hypothetical protein
MTKLDSNWVAGFIDGDGSFALDKSLGFYRPILSISQNDPQLLNKIKDFFGCGTVTRKDQKAWHYRCRSAQQFKNCIIPKLGKAPFQTIKQFQYELICEQALPLLQKNDPADLKELEDLDLQIKLSRKDLSYVNPNLIMNLNWFLGFFEAEGNFYVNIRKTDPVDLRISFKVTQKNKPLLEKIQTFFGFGAIQVERPEIWKYNVEGIKNVTTNVYSILRNQPLKGKKNLERVKFLSVIRILLKDGHKTTQGLEKIKKIQNWRAPDARTVVTAVPTPSCPSKGV